MSSGESMEEWEARLRGRSRELQQLHEAAIGQHDADALAGVADERDKLAQEYDELSRIRDELAAERDLVALHRDVVASNRDRTTRQATRDEDPGWANRWLSGTDRDGAASDRAAAFDDRRRARKDRSVAASDRAAAAQDRADAALSQQEGEALVDQLREALASRTVIGQATGILIERFKVPPEDAFQLLVRASQHRNIKLRLVAEDVVVTGRTPTDM